MMEILASLFEFVMVVASVIAIMFVLLILFFFLFVDRQISRRMKSKYGKNWFNEYTDTLYVMLTHNMLSDQATTKEQHVLTHMHEIVATEKSDYIPNDELLEKIIKHINLVMKYSDMKDFSYTQTIALINNATSTLDLYKEERD